MREAKLSDLTDADEFDLIQMSSILTKLAVKVVQKTLVPGLTLYDIIIAINTLLQNVEIISPANTTGRACSDETARRLIGKGDKAVGGYEREVQHST